MRRIIFQSFYLILLTAILSSVSFVQAQVRPYRVSDRQVQTLLTRIEQNTDLYKSSMETALNRGRLSGSDSVDMIMSYITEFENATDSLKRRFDSRQSVAADVEDVLNRAANINAFMQRNRMNAVSQRNWTDVRSDLNTLATYYRLSWNWTNPVLTTDRPYGVSNSTRPYRVSDTDVQRLLTRIETNTDSFRRAMDRSLDRSRINNTNSEDSINNFISEFETATDRLKQRFDSRQSVASDVEDVLMRANSIEGYLVDSRLNNNAQRLWSSIKSDLNMLAGYYSVSWDWNRRSNPSNPDYSNSGRSGRGFNAALTGTYRLNLGQSDNVREVIDRELRTYSTTQSDRLRTSLERRLQSPDMIVIEKRSNEVSMASSNAPQITFSADGVARTEQTPNGRSISVKATTDSDSLNISYEGDRMRDFHVDFMPINNGRQLRVTRRIYLENRSEMITVNSVYDKTSEIAQWSNVNTGDTIVSGNVGNVNVENFYIPNGTRVTAVLNNMINTKDSQDGDRFTMTVNSPSQYEGAVISGRILKTESSGRVTGRANISLDFDTIRLRNGQTYRFAGIIDGVTSANGENVSVNNEGAVRDSNQTTKTVTRAGIGAALGALIGAIAGGGEGAAIGAAVGAGAGAGTIFIQGRDNLELGQGSEFRITASAPNNISNR